MAPRPRRPRRRRGAFRPPSTSSSPPAAAIVPSPPSGSAGSKGSKLDPSVPPPDPPSAACASQAPPSASSGRAPPRPWACSMCPRLGPPGVINRLRTLFAPLEEAGQVPLALGIHRELCGSFHHGLGGVALAELKRPGIRGPGRTEGSPGRDGPAVGSADGAAEEGQLDCKICRVVLHSQVENVLEVLPNLI